MDFGCNVITVWIHLPDFDPLLLWFGTYLSLKYNYVCYELKYAKCDDSGPLLTC